MTISKEAVETETRKYLGNNVHARWDEANRSVWLEYPERHDLRLDTGAAYSLLWLLLNNKQVSAALSRTELTIALPHLVPRPTQNDEERARQIAEHAGIDMMDDHDLFIAEMSAAFATNRAETTLAENERCAKAAHDEVSKWTDELSSAVAAAIRRKP